MKKIMDSQATKILNILLEIRKLDKELDDLKYNELLGQLCWFFKEEIKNEFEEIMGYEYEREIFQQYLIKRVEYLFNL